MADLDDDDDEEEEGDDAAKDKEENKEKGAESDSGEWTLSDNIDWSAF